MGVFLWIFWNCLFKEHLWASVSKIFNNSVCLNIRNILCCCVKCAFKEIVMSGVWNVSKNNRTIGSRWRILQRTKECGRLSRRPEPYFWELHCDYKSAILSVYIYFLVNPFPLEMIRKLLRSWKNVTETSYLYLHLNFAETTW